MNAAMLMLAVAASGVVAGRAPLPDGGFEYVIQIEPHLLDAQRAGGVLISSDVPPGLRGARRYRLIVGEGPLPAGVTAVSDLSAEQLTLAPSKSSDPADQPPPVNPAAGVDTKAQPAEFQQPLGAKPLEEHVALRESSPSELAEETDSPEEASGQTQEEQTDDSEPWTALVLTVLGLFVSLGGNVYLGWNFLGLRKRYRAMVGRRG